MAQSVTVQLVDDFDGSLASETVRFALDGNNYEIDLNSDHAQAFRDALGKYVAKARKEKRTYTKPRSSQKGTPSQRGRTGAIRAWAKEQGIEVGDRGKIHDWIVEKYDLAHQN